MRTLFDIYAPQIFAEDIVVPTGMPKGEGLFWAKIIPGIIQLLLFAVFILSMIYLLWGGISWIFSGGNKEALEKAKKKVTYALVGLIIALLTWVLLGTFYDLFLGPGPRVFPWV